MTVMLNIIQHYYLFVNSDITISN